MIIDKNFTLVSLLVLISLTGFMAEAIAGTGAAQATLTLKPNQCVSVHQGEQCYVDIVIDWQTDKRSEYCLYASNQQAALQCWPTGQSGHFEREIATNENIVFSIKDKNNKLTLAHQTLKMAWVYKKNVRSRMTWRLF